MRRLTPINPTPSKTEGVRDSAPPQNLPVVQPVAEVVAIEDPKHAEPAPPPTVQILFDGQAQVWSGNGPSRHDLSKPTDAPWKFDPVNFSISQSLYKVYLDYKSAHECGIVFFEREIRKNPLFEDKDSPAKKLGRYFEYVATGYANPNEDLPEAEVYKTSGGIEPNTYKKGGLKPEYRLADEQAQKFKKILAAYGLVIVSAGKYFIDPVTKIRGLIDVIAKLEIPDPQHWKKLVGEYFNDEGLATLQSIPTMEECTYVDEHGEVHVGCIQIDTKYSALLRDEYNPMGWAPQGMDYKEKTMIQAKTYALLTGLPFFFFVFSSKDHDALIYHVWMQESKTLGNGTVLPGTLDEHRDEMLMARIDIINRTALGLWEAHPDYSRCIACPLAPNCEHKVTVPQIRAVALFPKRTR